MRSPAMTEFAFSLLTVFLALMVGGLAMAFTGSNPLNVYKDLWVGAGFDWPFHLLPGNPFGVEPLLAENNLVSTLVQFTPLVLTGFAVAFAFRCGLFNIGGTGQFWVGSVCALVVAQNVAGVGGMVAATVAAAIGGAIWAGIAGGLKAYRGAHEVITTIMLNWIAIYTTQYLFAVGGPLTDDSVGNGVSSNINSSAQYPGLWGVVQEIHIGVFVALASAVVYYVLLNRTTLGYEVRAVGFNPEAARYGGISVKRSIIASMAICGAFAGLAGAIQVLGVTYSIAVLGRARARHRLHRHRGRAARSQHRRRRGALGAPVRRVAERRAAALGLVQPRARERRVEHHPGHDHPARRWRVDRALAGRARQARARGAAADRAGPSPPAAAAPPAGTAPV